MHFKTLIGCLALTALVPSFTHAAREPCDCDNVSQIERQITEQEYLLKMFTQWKDYLPTALHTPDDVVERANMNFNLTFYGTPSQRPDVAGAGAGGAFGTLYKHPKCPLVEYLYQNGKPLMVETKKSKRENLDPPELEAATKRTSEAGYKSNECKALVHYAFVHEKSHQATCRDVHEEHSESKWDEPRFFIEDDIKAYEAGLKVLYAERKRLKAKCKTEKHDGRWHGVLQYSYTYNKGKREPFEKGSQIGQANAEGYFDSADRKSGRLRATIDAGDDDPRLKIPFNATRQLFYHHSKHLTVTGDCGWRPNVTLVHDGGIEQRSQGSTSGTADGQLRADAESLAINFPVKAFSGAWDESNWNVRHGDCGPKPNTEVWDSRKREVTMDGFSIDMKVPIDPDHPDDIDVTRIEPASDGVGQHYYSLKLHRVRAE
jgi:hypothetical protein